MTSVVDKLLNIFQQYASFGVRDSSPNEMDGARFSKFCKENGIIGGAITPGRIDIVFAKVKAKGARKIDFEGFLEALRLISLEKHSALPEQEAIRKLFQQVLDTVEGPKVSATVPAAGDGIYAKLTDSRLYTGTHVHRFDEEGHGKGLEGRDSIPVGSGTRPIGLSHPATPGLGRRLDLSDITRPELSRGGTNLSSAHTARQLQQQQQQQGSPSSRPATAGGAPIAPRSPTSAAYDPYAAYAAAASPARVPAPAPAAPAASAFRKDLRSVYLSFALFGSHEEAVRRGVETGEADMDSFHFAKLCRETGVLSGALTPASVDIAFSKVKEKGKRVIDFERFQVALDILASEKFPTLAPEQAFEYVLDQVCSCEGPVAKVSSSPRTTGNVFDKLTDERTYTGMHRARFDDELRRADYHQRHTLGVSIDEPVAGLQFITRPNLR